MVFNILQYRKKTFLQKKRMFKIFASGVNFSKNNAMFLFLSLKLLKFGEIYGVTFFA